MIYLLCVVGRHDGRARYAAGGEVGKAESKPISSVKMPTDVAKRRFPENACKPCAMMISMLSSYQNQSVSRVEVYFCVSEMIGSCLPIVFVDRRYKQS